MSLRILQSLALPERTRSPRKNIAAIAPKWEARKADGVKLAAANEFLLYGEIGGWAEWGEVSAGMVLAWLAERSGQPVSVRVNSPGGDVFEGVAIYNALQRHDGEVTIIVDSLAASAATIVMMAGDKIKMAANATMMIHPAWTYAAGGAEDFRKEAGILDSIDGNIMATYAARTGRPLDEIKPLVEAETWMNAQEAMDGKFIDEIEPAKTPPPPPTEPPAISAESRATFEAALKRFENRTATKLNPTKP